MDKVAGSAVGKGILDAIPEGHLIYDTVRTGVGAVDKGFHKASELSRGVERISQAKNLDSALKKGEQLFNAGKAGFEESKKDYREVRGKLEKVKEKRRSKRDRR